AFFPLPLWERVAPKAPGEGSMLHTPTIAHVIKINLSQHISAFSPSWPSREITPHPAPHFARRRPLPQGERAAVPAVLNDPVPHPSPHAHAFSQLSRGEPQHAWRHGGAGRTKRGRQDQLPGSDLVSVSGPRPSPGNAGGRRRQSGRRLLGRLGG